MYTHRSSCHKAMHNRHRLCVSESTYEDEEQFARGGTTPGEGVAEEDDGSGGGDTNFPLRMAADTTRGRISHVGGFLSRGAGQHVNFDPEAPPLPPHVAKQLTTSLLERPEVDKKVKVSNKYEIQFNALSKAETVARERSFRQARERTRSTFLCEIL